MFLVDTNVWLERLLDQAQSTEVGSFLDCTPSERLCMTDFAFHSIGMIMCRLNQSEALLRFVHDVFIDGAVTLIHLEPEDTQHLVQIMEKFNLDFDDAYQYASAEKYNLTIVSFDGDFDSTERGRITPANILKE